MPRVVTLAAFALVIRLVIDLATPLLPGAFVVLHCDGLCGITAAHGGSATPTARRLAASPEATPSMPADIEASPRRGDPALTPVRRNVRHPLRLPGDSTSASADRATDH